MQGGPFKTLVDPRVVEAFGGKRECDKAILRLYHEFRSTETDKEQCAIIGAAGTADHAFRIWSSHGTDHYIEVPFTEIVQVLSADTRAYEFGWVFAHTHKLNNKPSEEDNEATCALSWFSSLLELPMVDHWVFNMSGPSLYSYSKEAKEFLSPSIRFEVGE